MLDLPRPGIEPMSPALAGGFFITEPPGEPKRELFFFPKRELFESPKVLPHGGSSVTICIVSWQTLGGQV